MTTGQRDPLGVASRLAVLTNIQNAMRGSSLHCVVVRVEASWTCVVSTSLINGSFSGGAVVVTLNNGKRALACLAGSPHRADGGYRVVCTLMAEELVCHSTINARLIDDCATTKERNSAPQFTFAACFQEHEKARYLLLEKCPPEVMSCLFQSVELEVEGSSGTSPPAPSIGPVATAEDPSSLTIGQQEIEGEEQLPCTSRTVVVPLGSLGSIPVAGEFPTVASFRNAALAAMKSHMTSRCPDAGKDCALLLKSELAVEVLMGVSATAVMFTIDAHVRAAVVLSNSSIDTKERSIAVTPTALLLLKKKSSFPPPLWCYAFSWFHVTRIETPSPVSGHGGSSPVGGASTNQGTTRTTTREVTVSIFVKPNFPPSSLALRSGTPKDEESMWQCTLPSVASMVDFIAACRDAYLSATGLPLLVIQSQPPTSAPQTAPSLPASRRNNSPPGTTATPSMPPTALPYTQVWPLGNGNESNARTRYPPIYQRSGDSQTLPLDGDTADEEALLGLFADVLTRFPSMVMLLAQWSLSDAKDAYDSIEVLNAVAFQIVQHFAGLPPPAGLMMVSNPLTMTGRLGELVVASVELNTVLTPLCIETLPSMPQSYAAVHGLKILRCQLNADMKRSYTLSLSYLVLKGIIEREGRELWRNALKPLQRRGRLHAEVSPIPAANTNPQTGQIRIPDGANTNPQMGPPVPAANYFDHLIQLVTKVTEADVNTGGNWLVYIFQKVTASMAITTQHTVLPHHEHQAAQLISVMILDVIVDLLAEEMMNAGFHASKLSVLTILQAAPAPVSQANSPDDDSHRRLATLQTMQHQLADWAYAAVQKVTRPMSGSKHQPVPQVFSPSATTFAGQQFTLHNIVERVLMIDNVLPMKSYGLRCPKPRPQSLTALQWSSSLRQSSTSPLWVLTRYFSSGNISLKLLAGMLCSPMATSLVESITLQLSGPSMGSRFTQQTLKRRTASTQTLRTSSQEEKLLTEHFSLRSSVILDKQQNVQERVVSGADAQGVETCASVDDLETNKQLLRRVLLLEKQLTAAHDRHESLADEVKRLSDENAQLRAAHQSGVFSEAVEQQVCHARNELLGERKMLLEETELLRRVAIAEEEKRSWFTATSELFIALWQPKGSTRSKKARRSYD